MPKDSSIDYIIVRLARWHTLTRKKPEDAAPLYDYILANRQALPNSGRAHLLGVRFNVEF